MRVDVCDPAKYMAVSHFTDTECNAYSNPPVHGLMQGYCVNWQYSSGTYIKLTDMNLEGNKFGLEWADGWTIFICQTLLFGACGG